MATVVGGGQGGQMSERGLTALNVLRSCLHPKNYKLAPPAFSTRSSFQVSIEYNLNYEVVDPETLQDEAVPADQGLILWFLNRGVNSMFHMGIVDQGSISSVYTKGLNIWPRAANTAFPNGIFSHLNYNAPLALPYGGAGLLSAPDHYLINLAPELEKNFSKTRLYGGFMKVATSSNIKDFSNINGNGRFALGAISDTRDIAQVIQGSGWSAYSPTNLVTASITSKEGIKSAVANDGIVTIVGPDSAPTFSSPDRQNDDFLDAEFTGYEIVARQQRCVVPMVVSTDYGAYQQISSMWVSPWQTSVTCTVPNQHTNLTTGPIDEMGVLDIDLNLGRVFATQGPSSAFGNQVEVLVYFNSVYGAVGVAGRVVYNVEVTTEIRRFSDLYGNALSPNNYLTGVPYGVDTWTVKHRPRMQMDQMVSQRHDASFTRVGKYIGTFIQVVARQCVRQDGAIENADFTVVTYDNFLLKVRARSVDEHGSCGPVRVLRYESLNTKDTLRLDGMANVQCVPQSSLAPFTQSSAMYNPETSDFNMLPWLVLMFNSETRLKRNWALAEYQDLLSDFRNLTSIEQIVDWSRNDERLRIAGQSAGLFGDVGSFLGNMAGKLFGAGDVGSSIGNSLGGALDRFVGTGGVSVGGLDTLGKQGGLLGGSAGSFGGGSYMFTGNPQRRDRSSATAASF